MQKIVPHLWFNENAQEAVHFYTSIFKNSKIGASSKYSESGAKVSGMKKGMIMSIEYSLNGQDFLAINGGPIFTFNPSISFFVTVKTSDEVDKLWKELSEGGMVLMELAKYPFSERYGWCSDKYGVSWQISKGDSDQTITTSIMFVGKANGKAEEALNFYTKLFPDSKIEMISRYEKGEGDTEGHIKFAPFTLSGRKFSIMESGMDHKFSFTPAISLLVNCDSQEEIDNFWQKMSADPKAEQCGWLTDKYGVSWQITPRIMREIMADPDEKRVDRVSEVFLKMKKLDMREIIKTYNQK